MRILVVCAVVEEAQAVEVGRSLRHELDVLVCGVGPAAAAAATARTIAENSQMGRAYDVVVNAGICGAFRGRARIGDLLIGTDSVAADPVGPEADLVDRLEPRGEGDTEFGGH
ncbi:MAG TPA: hypothetical protein VHG10_01140, partial [Glycomyces sp.]|nr:hypothetical protein [Glycomyces sp.]